MDVISSFTARFERSREEELSLEDYLAECKRNPLAYATAAERMLKAIGEPKIVDTRNDSRLSRIFANKVIKVYPAFAEFYGMEDAIEQVVALLPPCGAGPGREEADPLSAGPGGRRQEQHRRAAEAADAGRALLCHQGLAGERIAAGPVRRRRRRADPRIRIRHPAPLPEPHPQPLGGEAARRVRRRHPQVQGGQAPPQHPQAGGISKTEPGDENNQDISSLVGKVDIRKLETFAQDDPDAYSYSGGLCLANQGLLDSSRCSRRRSRCCIHREAVEHVAVEQRGHGLHDDEREERDGDGRHAACSGSRPGDRRCSRRASVSHVSIVSVSSANPNR